MTERRTFTFARTFKEEPHAQAFLQGQLRMQTVDHFRKLEDSEEALRGDVYEGASGIFQPSSLAHIKIGGHLILANQLTQALRFHQTETLAWHVFCLHAIGMTPEDPEIRTIEDAVRAMQLDARCSRLGQHVVYLTDVGEFFARVSAAAKARKLDVRSGPVRYFDETAFSGFFAANDVPFKKPMRFAYQKEYRIVLRSPLGTPSPYTLDIGSISDIAELTTAERFNASIEVRPH